MKNAYKDVAGLYETDSLINNRPAFEKEVEALLKERLSTRGFTFTNIQSSVKPNDVLQAAIDEKNTAVQNALKVENEKKAAIAEAEKVVAAAKGKADANRILQQSITPELIQLKAVEKWDEIAVVYRWKYVAIPEVAMTISMRPHWQLDSFGEVLIVCADNHK